jgi:large subunit ribosomal protein L19
MNKSALLKAVEQDHLRKTRIPRFDVGDVIRVSLKIKEGEKERIQAFEGVVIGRMGTGINEMIKVRRIASGVGVERTLLIHSPLIQGIKIMKRSDVSRAKLYYLRNRTGKKAKLKQLGRDKLLQIQAAELKALEEEQASSARQAAEEAAAKAAQEQEVSEAKA